jgi:SAM-dependent methyltransferase
VPGDASRCTPPYPRATSYCNKKFDALARDDRRRKGHPTWFARAYAQMAFAIEPEFRRQQARFQSMEWDIAGKTGDFVRTGKPVDFHEHMSPREWAVYQDGMRDVAANPAVELAKRLPVPQGATRLLDIGGSHGLFSSKLCKRHPALAATILELPDAIDRASEIGQREGLGDRVKHCVGNALMDDLGEATFDVVIVNNLVHHFSPEQNSELAKRVARALSPGGVYSIGDFLRPSHPGAGGGVPAVMDLYFALTSASGTWALQEIVAWQRDAGLAPMKAIKFPSLPGWASAPAAKGK